MGVKTKARSFLAALVLVITSGCRDQDGVTVVKLAHGLDVNHSVHKAMEIMAQDLNVLSQGSMRIDIYPNEQLGTERQLLELLQIGSVGMTKVSAAVLENFAPEFRVLGLPYIFDSETHHFEVLDGTVGSDMLLSLETFRLRGLTFYDAGSRSFYLKEHSVKSPADLEGLKIRTQESATAMELVRRLGGSATPIAWGELFSALQQGIVDGAENNLPSFYLSGHFETARYYSVNEHTRVPDVLLISTLVWDTLTELEQSWLTEAAHNSKLKQRELWKESVEQALFEVQAAGVKVTWPDQSLFAARVKPIYDSFRNDPRMYELIQNIRRQPD